MKKRMLLTIIIFFLLGTFRLGYCETTLTFIPPPRGYNITSGIIKEITKTTLTLTNQFLNETEELAVFTCSDIDTSSFNIGETVQVYYNYPDQLLYITAKAEQSGEKRSIQEKTEFLKAVHILSGDETGSLNLEQTITRAEFVSLLIRKTSISAMPQIQTDVFSDCKNHWAKNDILCAFNAGITQGISDTEFGPDEPVTFEQMLVFTMRFLKMEKHFPVYGDNLEGYLAIAKKANIISQNDTLNTSATREHAISIIYAICPHRAILPASSSCPGMGIGGKPVIYLYPEQEQKIRVRLELNGTFLFTYPAYRNGWNVTARPDGTIFSEGKEYSYLFWEGSMPAFQVDFSEGYVVSREDTVPFLQDILSRIGLLPKEYNEFIVYWAPKLQQNAYNKIYFSTKEYESAAKLIVSPTPDSMLRVFMVFDAADQNTILPPQKIVPFERKGFTVVEWGGYEIRESSTY